jgi:zinc protease
MTGLISRAHDTRRMAALTFFELAYPDNHPYSCSLSGYPETISAITRDDIVNFQRNLGPKGAIIVVVGAIKSADAVKMVEAAFGDWNNPDQPPPPQAAEVPKLKSIARKNVAIAGKTQADIIMGNPGPSRNAPDFQAARMANSILGVFGLMGRLGDSVRESQGLAYYSYSQLEGGFGPGPWKISAGVDPRNVDLAVETIQAEIRKITTEPVTPEEIADNKSYFKGQLVLGLETNEGVAGSIMNMEKHDLGLDYLHRYPAMIDGLKVSDLQAAAAHYLDPDRFALAVAGPAS